MSLFEEKTVRRVKNVLCVAEQGLQTIPYDKVEVMADGPKNVDQVTLSIGFTQYGGNLRKVIDEYVIRQGQFSSSLAEYAGRMKESGLAHNQTFLTALRRAGREDPVMGQVQESLFRDLYLKPAATWGMEEGFEEPFSYLVICDSFLHSGSILPSLRKRFTEKTPKAGGREKGWTADYLQARHKWLSGHSNRLVRNSAYRTKYYKELLALEDWKLDRVHEVALNGIFPLEVA
jgi:chitosanase